MRSIEYYKDNFKLDLKYITERSPGENKISIFFLIMKGKAKIALKSRKFPRQFLFCYFYTALLDQAIHSSLSHEIHSDFDNIAGYPKLAGLFHSFNSNIHPGYLLLLSTEYIENENNVLDDFSELTHFFLNEYIDFFKNVFPQYSMDMTGEENQKRALDLIFREIDISIKWDNVPKEMKDINPNVDLYKNLLLILQKELKQYTY